VARLDPDRWRSYLYIDGGWPCWDHEGRRPAPWTWLDWFDGCRRVLDIGCGTGAAVTDLRSRGIDAVGLTINPDEAAVAQGRYGLDLVIGDMHRLPFDDGGFDGVLAWAVVEHSIAPYIMMCEANRVLIEEGKALMFIPGEDWVECIGHYAVLNRRQMRWLCGRTGFHVDRCRHLGKEAAVYQLHKTAPPPGLSDARPPEPGRAAPTNT